jgi:hypothetical protein
MPMVFPPCDVGLVFSPDRRCYLSSGCYFEHFSRWAYPARLTSNEAVRILRPRFTNYNHVCLFLLLPKAPYTQLSHYLMFALKPEEAPAIAKKLNCKATAGLGIFDCQE